MGPIICTQYEFTTVYPSMSGATYVREHVIVKGRRAYWGGRSIARAAAASKIAQWRRWAATCPEQSVRRQVARAY